VYQHFLRYFPDEVSAKTGLIACHAQLKDVKGALALLDQYEQDVVLSGASGELVVIYRDLAEFDPINPHILEGYKKACEAAGMPDEAAQLESKIQTLKKLSSKPDTLPAPAEASTGADDLLEGWGQAPGLPALPGGVAGMDAGVYMPVEGDEPPAAEEEAAAADVAAEGGVEALLDYGEIEIEVDIDDFPFEGSPAMGEDGGTSDEWPDAFDDVADLISNSPRSVKFGSSLDGSDAQTHYDLGVAFKEMGLYDEAINEFRQAAGDPARRVECLVLQAACLRERGELDTAERMLSSLIKPEQSVEETCSVRYELALVLEAQGQKERAAALMAEIDAVNAGFRDVHERLKNAGGSLEFSDEELQGFELK
jgi:tetratricopeptide (TPR) repeat protein